MNITKEKQGDALVVKADGWLDVQSNREFAEFMNVIPVQEKLILDLEGLEYISSAGIREIVAIILKQPAGTFSIINVNATVMAVFEMIGLQKKVSIQTK